MKLQKLTGFLAIVLLLTSCATGDHGTFVTSTYTGDQGLIENVALGEVTGNSEQTWFLYFFPLGEAPSTFEAIQDAKSQIDDTRFLIDVSIDDSEDWKFGYSIQRVEVRATAYK